MFNVKGWSLSADKLKPELKAISDSDAKAKTKNKKRKRSTNDAPVTAENVADYWEQVIEGKEKRTEKANSRPSKKQRHPSKAGDSSTRAEKTLGHATDRKMTKKSINDEKNKEKDYKSDKRPKKNSAKHEGEETKAARNQGDVAQLPDPERVAALAPNTAGERVEKLTPLQAKMRAKLVSARFRHLNQTLYTRPSDESLSIFSESPDMFREYHEGFRRQVAVWPENPVDGYIALLQSRAHHRNSKKNKRLQHCRPYVPRADAHGNYPAIADQPLPVPGSGTANTVVVADLGCGDAKLATVLGPEQRRLRLDVRSFDLVSTSPLVTRADMACLPLTDGTVDVAIFCLALMGTNWLDFVEEAWRILRRGGELWVAEIKSRFVASTAATVRGASGNSGGKKPVPHSVGSRRKQQLLDAATKKELRARNEAEAREHEAELAVVVDGAEDVAARTETDVTAFVDAMQRRGFLPMHASDALQMGNKMFVKMFFVKMGEVMRGKHAGKGDAQGVSAAGGSNGFEPTGRFKAKSKMKFMNDLEDDIEKAEKAILKPCVYKLR